jgi:hypothetical protein
MTELEQTKAIDAGMAAMPAPVPARSHRAKRLEVVLLVLTVGALTLAGLAWLSSQSTKSSEAADRAAYSTRLDEANRRIEALGGTPVGTPSPGATGERGATGPGPSPAEIQYAVDTYCAARSGCAGIPSKIQVTAAVRAYCAAGVCRGPAGAAGKPGASVAGAPGVSGAPGASGAAGAPGPAPTDAQITQAIAAYCTAHGNCTGPAGPQGDPGRGISSLDCSTPSGKTSFVVHYDDGTSQTVQCSASSPSPSVSPPVLPIPAPSPS